MSKVLARTVTALVGGSYPAGLTDCNLSLNLVMASSQTKDDKAPVDEPIRVTGEVSLSGVTGRETTGDMTIEDFKAAAKVGTKFTVEYIIGTLANYGGEAMISSYNESAPVEDKITYSVTLRSTSAITKGAAAVATEETGEGVAAYDPESATNNEEE